MNRRSDRNEDDQLRKPRCSTCRTHIQAPRAHQPNLALGAYVTDPFKWTRQMPSHESCLSRTTLSDG